jgi:hypothetical protein
MKTLKELIEGTKCRKGTAEGTTKDGAYWLATKPILIRSFGGDGIGQSSTDLRNYLELRHYRDGSVCAVINFHGWHQNYGTSNRYKFVNGLLECCTVEDVAVYLKGTKDADEDYEAKVYSDRCSSDLENALVALGLPIAPPSPDEE